MLPNTLHIYLLAHRHEAAVGTAEAGAAVTDGVVGDRELTEVVANHISLDLNQVEDLAVVDSDLSTNHLGDDDHVAEVSLDGLGLLESLALCRDR